MATISASGRRLATSRTTTVLVAIMTGAVLAGSASTQSLADKPAPGNGCKSIWFFATDAPEIIPGQVRSSGNDLLLKYEVVNNERGEKYHQNFDGLVSMTLDGEPSLGFDTDVTTMVTYGFRYQHLNAGSHRLVVTLRDRTGNHLSSFIA